MNRRVALKWLATVPVIGWLLPKAAKAKDFSPPPEILEDDQKFCPYCQSRYFPMFDSRLSIRFRWKDSLKKSVMTAPISSPTIILDFPYHHPGNYQKVTLPQTWTCTNRSCGKSGPIRWKITAYRKIDGPELDCTQEEWFTLDGRMDPCAVITEIRGQLFKFDWEPVTYES